MPRVTIPGVGDVQFPDNMPHDEIMRQAEAMRDAPAQGPLLDPRDLPSGELLKGGAHRAWEGLKGTVVEGIPALAESAFGYDQAARKNLEAYQARMARAEEESPTAYRSLKDISGPSGSTTGFLAESLGELLPDVAGFIGTAGVGEIVGKKGTEYAVKKGVEKAVEKYALKKGLSEEAASALQNRVLQQAGKKGADIGGKAGLWGASLATNVPDTFNQIYQDTGDLRPGIALTIGPIVAALDTYLPGKVLSQLGSTGKQALAAQLLEKSKVVPTTWKKAFIGETLKTITGEGLTEGAQQALQNYASILAGKKDDFFSQQNVDDIIMSALKGAIGGGVIGAPGAALEAGRIKSARQAEIDRRAALEQQGQQITEQAAAQQAALGYTPEQLAALGYTPQQPAPTAGGALVPAGGTGLARGETPINFMGRENVPAAQQGQIGVAPTSVPTTAQALDINRETGTARVNANVPGALPGQQGLLNIYGNEPVSGEELASRMGAERLSKQAGYAKLPGAITPAGTRDELMRERSHWIRVLDTPQLAAAHDLAIEHIASITQHLKQMGEAPKAEGQNVLQFTPEAPQGTQFKGEPFNPESQFGQQMQSVQRQREYDAALEQAEQQKRAQLDRGLEQQFADEAAGKFPVTFPEAKPGQAAEPQQLELFGQRGRPSRAEGIRQGQPVIGGLPVEQPAVSTVLDADTLQRTGLKPQAGIYKQLLNKDMANPDHQVAIGQAFASARANPNLSPNVKQAIERLSNQAQTALATQQEMFGPKGGVLKGATLGTSKQRTVSPTDRTGAQVPVEPERVAPAQGVTTPQAEGLGAAPVSAPVSRGRKAAQPSPLKGEKRESRKQTKPAKTPVQAAIAEESEEPTSTESVEQLKERFFALTDKLHRETDPDERDAIKDELTDLREQIAAAEPKAQKGETGEAYKGDVAQLAKDLRAALHKMGLGGIGVRLEKALTDKNGNTIQGQYAAKLIQIALNAKDVFNTLNHEALHAMKEMGFFSPEDWKTLSNMAESKWLKQYDIAAKYPNLTREEQIEEAIAEAFAHYQQQEPKTQSIISRVINALRKLGNFLTGYDTRSAEDIFGQAASGELAKARAEAITNFDSGVEDALSNPVPKYQVAGASQAIKGMDGLINSFKFVGKDQKYALSEGVHRTKGMVSSGILGLQNLNVLIDNAKKLFPNAARIGQLMNERSGYEGKLHEGAEGVRQIIRKALNAHPEQVEAINRIINDSTVDEVDPTKSRADYKGQTTKDGRSKEEVWNELRERYNKLKPAWQKAYVSMRKAYEQMFTEIEDAIKTRIDATPISKETKEKIKTDILERLSKAGKIDPYFALGRDGDLWLASNFKDENGQAHFTVEAFTSPLERTERRNAILKMDPNARSDEYSQVKDIDYRNAPPNSFVNSALNIMEANGVPQDAIDEMMRLFVTTLPETALAKSMQRRSGREGYTEDAIKTFEKKMRTMAHQITNMRYNPQFDNVITAMRQHTNMVGKGMAKGSVDAFGRAVKETVPARDNADEHKYLDEFEKRVDYIKNPTRNNFGEFAQSMAFIYTMGANFSSALMQVANVPMIVAPYLSGKYAKGNVSKALSDALKAVTGSGRTAYTPVLGSDELVTRKAMQSIGNYAPNSAFAKKHDIFLRELKNNGQLNRSQINETLQGDINGTKIQKVNAMAGWMLHHTERVNREVTMLAAYNLEMERLAKPNKADIEAIEDIKQERGGITDEEAKKIYATRNAITTNEITNGNLLAGASPRFAHSTIGKMAFMYKKFALTVYSLLIKAAKDMVAGETPEIRRAAMRQLAGTMGMTALFAGAQGLPFIGALSMLWDLFKDDDDDDLKTTMRKHFGELLYKGPLEYMTNLSVASRMGLSDLILRDAPSSSSTSTFAQRFLQSVGGPVFGVEQNLERGFSKIASGHLERGVEDLLPTFAANPLKAYRYATEGTRTLRGDPITGDVSAYNVVGQMLGFAPADYIRQMEINDREKGIDKALSDRQSKLKQRFYMAKREGDTDEMNDIRDRLLQLGQKHPELKINGSTIYDILDKSVKAQDRATKEMIAGVRYNKKRLQAVKADMAEFD